LIKQYHKYVILLPLDVHGKFHLSHLF